MNLTEIAKNSLINCHAMGLDSVVFTPDVRMFVARPSHELWRNSGFHMFTIGMHPHHRDITIVPLYGRLWNVEFAADKPVHYREYMHKYRYSSAIRDGVAKLTWINGEYSKELRSERVTLPRFMSAHEFHSVYVPKGEAAAWYIFSGKENPSHQSVLYSNDCNLDRADFSKLYQPMSEEYLQNLLCEVFPEGV